MSYRADLALDGRRVLVVGGGAAALPRIAGLRGAGAQVTVVAGAVLPAVRDMADRGLLQLIERDVAPADLAGSLLVVAASGDPEIDADTQGLADAAGLLCLAGQQLSSAAGAAGRRRPGGKVVLVGGGPGDPGLLTLTGLLALREADVIVSDRLAPLAALAEAKPGAELIDVSKIPHGGVSASQDDINRLLIEHAAAGKLVVRFKGGDNFVFGRGGEEWQACVAAGIAVEVVPGVTSAVAGPALAAIPVTHRGLNQGFTVISGHVPPGDPRSTLDYQALARSGTDLVILMGVATLPAIADALVVAGMPSQTPAATVADAGLASQQVVRGTVGTIAADCVAAGITSPAITVIGAVAGFDPGRPG